MGNADLRRSQHMAGGMQRHGDAIARDAFAKGQGLDANIPKSLSQDRSRIGMTDVKFAAKARMIGMSMGDDRALHRAHRIDMKIAHGAIKAVLRSSN